MRSKVSRIDLMAPLVSSCENSTSQKPLFELGTNSPYSQFALHISCQISKADIHSSVAIAHPCNASRNSVTALMQTSTKRPGAIPSTFGAAAELELDLELYLNVHLNFVFSPLAPGQRAYPLHI